MECGKKMKRQYYFTRHDYHDGNGHTVTIINMEWIKWGAQLLTHRRVLTSI